MISNREVVLLVRSEVSDLAGSDHYKPVRDDLVNKSVPGSTVHWVNSKIRSILNKVVKEVLKGLKSTSMDTQKDISSRVRIILDTELSTQMPEYLEYMDYLRKPAI